MNSCIFTFCFAFRFAFGLVKFFSMPAHMYLLASFGCFLLHILDIFLIRYSWTSRIIEWNIQYSVCKREIFCSFWYWYWNYQSLWHMNMHIHLLSIECSEKSQFITLCHNSISISVHKNISFHFSRLFQILFLSKHSSTSVNQSHDSRRWLNSCHTHTDSPLLDRPISPCCSSALTDWQANPMILFINADQISFYALPSLQHRPLCAILPLL